MDAKLKSSVTASIFDTPLSAVLGKRLGVPFTRAQQEEICVYLHTSDTMEENYTVLILEQSGLGVLGISTVVWDSGLLMVDYLISRKGRENRDSSCSHSIPSVSNSSLGTCLDLGCGTGVVGLTALLLGAEKCVFSDKSVTP